MLFILNPFSFLLAGRRRALVSSEARAPAPSHGLPRQGPAAWARPVHPAAVPCARGRDGGAGTGARVAGAALGLLPGLASVPEATWRLADHVSPHLSPAAAGGPRRGSWRVLRQRDGDTGDEATLTFCETGCSVGPSWRTSWSWGGWPAGGRTKRAEGSGLMPWPWEGSGPGSPGCWGSGPCR